jgi:hypothetical protein
LAAQNSMGLTLLFTRLSRLDIRESRVQDRSKLVFINSDT